MLKEEVPSSGYMEVLFDFPGVAKELYPFQRIRYSFLRTKYTQHFLVYGWNLTYATHFKQASYLPFLYFVFERFFLRPSAILNTEIYAPAVQAADSLTVYDFWLCVFEITYYAFHL